MIDQTTLAYVNLYAILGALPELIRLDDAARQLLEKAKPTRLGISVKGGPAATLVFEDGACHLVRDVRHTDILLNFKTVEKFNGMIDGTVKPFPSKGFTRIFFLLRTFTKLTDRLSEYLKTPVSEMNPDMARRSTELMLYVIGGAIAEIANHDKVGKVSASNTVDGQVLISIKDGPAITITAKDHAFESANARTETPRAIMEFGSYELARQLFDGQVNAMVSVAEGNIAMRGMISMLDNVNRVLDRVSQYLA